MNKQDLAYPEDGETLTVTCFAAVHYRRDKIATINLNRNPPPPTLGIYALLM